MLASAVFAQEFVSPAEVESAGQALDLGDEFLGAPIHFSIKVSIKLVKFDHPRTNLY